MHLGVDKVRPSTCSASLSKQNVDQEEGTANTKLSTDIVQVPMENRLTSLPSRNLPENVTDDFQNTGSESSYQHFSVKPEASKVEEFETTTLEHVSQEVKATGLDEKDPSFRFLLVGKTGSGKSSAGNTILGSDLFESEMSFDSITGACSFHKNTRKGNLIEVMDSPGLFDTKKKHEEIAGEVVKSVACMHPGPVAILYVISANSRYTEEEKGVYERLKALFDKRVTEYMIILFTHGDVLKKKNKTIHDLLKTAPKHLLMVLRECNNRYVLFDNYADDKALQVDQLLEMVSKLSDKHGGQPYKCPKYGDVGEKMEKEVARRMQKVEEKEAKRKRYVQELEEKTKQVQEEAKKEKQEFEERERKRSEEIRKKEAERDEQMKALVKSMENQQLTAERMEQKMKEFQLEMEKRKNKELEDMAREREKEISALEEKHKKLQELNESLLRAEKEESKRRDEEYQEEMLKLKAEVARKWNCVVQ